MIKTPNFFIDKLLQAPANIWSRAVLAFSLSNSTESQKSKSEVLCISANCSQIRAVMQSLSSKELQLVFQAIYPKFVEDHYVQLFYLNWNKI